MQSLSSWGTEDRKTLLHLSDSTLDTFLEHAQTLDSDCEAGGVLLGSVHRCHMLIERATHPTGLDKRFRNLFVRLPFGHQTISLARWISSKGTIRYLGEWHTHPEDHPLPSGLDRSEWNRLSGRRLDKRPMLAVIVGRASLYVELVPSSGRGEILRPIA